MKENIKINGRSYPPLNQLYRDCAAQTPTEKMNLLEAMLEGLSKKVTILPQNTADRYQRTLENIYTRVYAKATPQAVPTDPDYTEYDD